MTGYIIRRIAQAVPLLLGVSVLLFVMLQLAPGGPDAVYAQNPRMSAEDRARIRRIYGLDQPVPVQYARWITRALRGDLGHSYVEGRPVADMIVERLPATLTLMGAALGLSLMLATGAGIWAGMHPRTASDYAITGGAFFGFSMPVFWFGLLLQLTFADWLGWLPSAGRGIEAGPVPLLTAVRHLVLPAVVLSLLYTATWSRYLRSSLIDQLSEEYLRTARAKGLGRTRAVLRHAVRNALIPVVTIVALQLPGLFTGAIITETIFAWPGIGRLYFTAVGRQDYSVLMGILLVASGLVAAANLFADVLVAWLDPRVSYE